MEASLDRKVNLNISQQADLPAVPESKTAEQLVLKPLLARLSNLTVSAAPMDLDALLARLTNENANSKEQSAKQYLRSVYSTILARVKSNGQISEKNIAILQEAENLAKKLEDITKQLADETAKLEELKKQINTQTATITELEIKTAMLAREVELVRSMQLTPAEKRIAELKKKRLAEQDAMRQEELDRQISEAEKDLLAAQANLAKAQLALATAQGALATAQGNLVAMQSQVSAATKAVTETTARKVSTEAAITACTDQLTDEEVARALVDALRSAAEAKGINFDEGILERSEDKEKYLEEHSVARILQDAVDRRDQEMQDTIASRREEKV